MTMSLLLAACGGSPDESTPTTVPATEQAAAASSEPTATLEPTPSPTYTPEPTATPRPAIISSTPRPIATRPPAIPTATPEPEQVIEDQLALDFEQDAGSFPTGAADNGYSLEVTDGMYVVTMPEGYWLNPLPSSPELTLRNGTVSVNVALAGGEGFAGVIGRQMFDADGNEAFLACGIYSDGSAGCYEFAGAEATETIFMVAGSFEMTQMNTLTLTIVDGWYSFDVNDVMMGEAYTAHEVDGNWGLFVQSMVGTFAAGFDWFTVRNPTLAATTFDSGSAEPFFSGTYSDGASNVEVINGAYTLTLTGAIQWTFLPPQPPVPFKDGLVETVTSLEGLGGTGVIARATVGESGLVSGYVCEMTHTGAADCYVVDENQWTYLFGSVDGAYDPTGANLITLRIVGEELQLSVNGEYVAGSIDGTFGSGEWGMYTTFKGGDQIITRFDSILILDTSIY